MYNEIFSELNKTRYTQLDLQNLTSDFIEDIRSNINNPERLKQLEQQVRPRPKSLLSPTYAGISNKLVNIISKHAKGYI